jgi:dipeptidyl aminopeptidase/acylaminoacyl peptidase
MHSLTRLSATFALATVIAIPAAAQDNAGTETPETAAEPIPGVTARPMAARDLITMPRLGTPIVTAAGDRAVYSVTSTDAETLRRSSAYYLLDLTREGAEPVGFDLGLDGHSLAFGPGDALYFLSSGHTDETAARHARVWRAALGRDGTVGAPTPVADMGGTEIDGFKLSPDGSKIALWSAIARDCPEFGCAGDGEAHLPGPGTGRLYDGEDGFARHWDRWSTPGTVNRVFVFNLEGGQVVGKGTPVDGIEPATGITGDTPTMPFGGGEDIAWSPDGKTLYFVAREANAREPFSTDLDIYASDLSGAAPKVLTGDNQATDTLPVPSPDGKYLAYLAMARPGYEADRLVIQLRNLATGETRALTQDIDRSFGEIAWSSDSRAILATAQDVLDTPVYRIDIRTGKATRLDLMAGNEAHIAGLTPLPGNRLVFTRDSIGGPREMYLSEGLQQARPMTDVAMTRMGELASVNTRRFSFVGAGGDTVWGQITRLEDQTGAIPAILYIHGGPQGSFNDSWSTRWNPRVLASQGYAVISVDFHGSTGYGQAFTDAINRDWGGKPLEDLQKGLDAALALDPQVDGTRACAMGASYGGYMVNWIAGNWADRFDCLVQHDGLFDLRSFYYSTEELWFPRWDFGGSYSEARETYEKWNPVNHVDKWRTPMLVVTGEKDFRVPYTQGLQSFTALTERRIPAKLLVFPDENHWVLGAKNSLQWHNTVFDWLARWLKPEDAAGAGE